MAERSPLSRVVIAVVLTLFLVSSCCAVGWRFLIRDNFTDGLAVPAGYPLREPIDPREVDHPADPGGDVVVRGGAPSPAEPDPTVNVNLDWLCTLDAEGALQLEEGLAASPFWHVGDDRAGRRFAFRRFVEGPPDGLNDSLGGDLFLGGPSYGQVRVQLGFGGSVDVAEDSEGRLDARCDAGLVILDAEYSTYLVVSSPEVVVVIFEAGPDRDRPLTRAGVGLLASELPALAEAPPASTRGEPGLEISDEDDQPGMYNLRARLNPAAPGQVYVRADEPIRNIRLSEEGIRFGSLQRIGNSDDPEELFDYRARFLIAEGEPGDYYPARIAVWFVPDDGGPARELLADTFRIEGWNAPGWL